MSIRHSICMECGKKIDRAANEQHTVAHCINGLKFESERFKACRLELQDAHKRIDELRVALKNLSDTVDESLLLDENLAEDWDVLRESVIRARKTLGASLGAQK